MVEQIFERIPKSDLEDEHAQAQVKAQAQQSGGGSDWFTGGSGSGSGVMSREYELTDEQKRYLKYCPKNDDGEPIDEDGNSLIPDPGDLGKIVEEGCKDRKGESEDYIPTYQNGMSGTRV